MKRVFSLALAALLLAGCTAAPADGSASSAAVTAETSTAQEAETTAAAPSSAAVLRPLWLGDEKQYYMNEMVTGELIRYTTDVEHEYLGLISTEDFLNGVPNYTEVGEYII